MPFWKTIKDEITINFVADDPDEVDPSPVARHKKEPKQKKVKEKKEVVEEPEEEDVIGAGGGSCSSRYLYNRYYQIFYVLLLCLFLGLLLPFILTSTVLAPPSSILNRSGYCFVNDSFKYECRGGNDNQSVCESHGCCYSNSSLSPVPNCFHSQPSDYGYAVHNTSTDPLTSILSKNFKSGRFVVKESITRSTYRLGTQESMKLNLKVRNERTKTPYDGDMWPAQLIVERKGDDVVRLSLFSPGHDEGALLKDPTFSPSPASSPNLEVEVTQEKNGAFNITVYRSNGNKEEAILRTIFGPVIMGDGYMEFTTTLPSERVFGLGYRLRTQNSPQFDNYEKWSLNSRDPSLSNISLYDTSSNKSAPYATFPGTHPFYMGMETSGQVHGVYVRTSSPLQMGTIPAPGLSFRSLMGAFKVLVMAGPTPRKVSNQYTDLVGKPSLPPYWAFGFHLCRTVVTESQQSTFRASTDGMAEALLSYDSDCLDTRLTYPDPFGTLPAWATDAVDELHTSGRKFLAVTYPFVQQGTAAYKEAESVDILMKLPGPTAYYGKVGGTAVGYPDYLDENSYNNWLNGSTTTRVRFDLSDGAMLLHNTPLNEAIVTYDLNESQNLTCTAALPETCCRRSGYEFQVDLSVEEASNGTICWAAVHSSLGGAPHVAHHNAYGMHHTKRIHDVIKSLRPSSRPVVLSSSTHPESGRYGGEFSEGWGVGVGEQKRALHHMLETGLYGLLMAGTPPCGTRNDTSVDEDSWQVLCLRSYQMSLFFPLLLSHYELDQFPTNPPLASPGLARQLRPFLMLRYTLLPTLYTLAEEASREGVPPIRPLFYEFPGDEGSLNVTDQFLVGAALLVVPNFEPANTKDTIDVQGYLPPGCWYNLFSGLLVSCHTNGTSVLLPTLFSDINALLRGGQALFLQGNLHDEIKHSEDSRAKDFNVVVAVDNSTTSIGEMYYDDGSTLQDAASYRATRLTAQLTPGDRLLKVYRSPVTGASDRYCDSNNLHSSTVQKIIIYGLEPVQSVLVGNTALPAEQFSQDSTTGRLVINDVSFNWCQKSSVEVTWTF